MQSALELLLEAGEIPDVERVKELVQPLPPAIPAMAVPDVDLALYDTLLGEISS